MSSPGSRAIEPNAIYTAAEAARLIAIHPDNMRKKLRLEIIRGSRRLGNWRVKGNELLKLADPLRW